MASELATLPPLAPFPEAVWREHLVPEEWQACLESWITLAEAHLSLSGPDFSRISVKDESLPIFLISYAHETALSPESSASTSTSHSKKLRKQCFLLINKLLDVSSPPETLLRWNFLADFTKIYGRAHTTKVVGLVWKQHLSKLELSLASLKASLTKQLEAGLKGNLKHAEEQLKQLNHLLHASPEISAFFMAGSDFLDSLISCYKLTNPPLRKVIISATYLCLTGLTEGSKPNFSSLVDQLYSLEAAAKAHKSGPTNVNDSLVAEIVTTTPILKQVQLRMEANHSGSNRAKSVLKALESFRKPGASGRPARFSKSKVDKGKGVGIAEDYDQHGSFGSVHVHRMSLISQVQDLFPDLGSGFIVKLLDEYNENVELTISHLLEGSLPAHLENANHSESLAVPTITGDLSSDILSNSVPPQLSTRRNVFDDDEFDQLAFDTSKLHFGRRNPDQTADDVLQDKSNAPNKAAILSALAAFDSDDDERDDTYDIEDVGGTVDSAAPGNSIEEVNADVRDGHDEALFRAYKTTPKLFERDAATRRSKPRADLREQMGMTDEAIEGWALMLTRDSRQMKRLEIKFSAFSGAQKELAPTSWRANPSGSGTEDSDVDGNNRGRGGFRGRPGRGGQGRGRGNVAGPTGDRDTEVARQRKESNKGSRANHNRRDQRAKKMARGGFPG